MLGDVTAGPGTSPSGSPSPAPLPGDVVGDKYRLEAVIGRGGMSVVYRATHLQLDQQVALKVLSAEALLLPEYIVRLRREARAVSRMRSEHVVRVHDIGELETKGDVPGVPYLVMEYLSGLDLAAVLACRGPMSVDLAVECILQACEALAEAHALGIVHRDLKPANLFLTESADGSPCVKVLDFGISRMSRGHGLTSLTDPGTVLGTPSYMAPEQMEAGDTVDARSDIWALGTILHELLLGKPPYTGDSLPQIFMKIMRSRPPRASRLRAGVPSEIDAIVAQCLAIEPTDRFQTVAELAWALSAVGTPHARDSAERISRVFDKRSSEAPPAPSGPPAPRRHAMDAPARGTLATRKVTAAIASAAILGAASVLGMMVARGAVDATARAATPSSSLALTAELAAPVTRDAALAIAPVTRPGVLGATLVVTHPTRPLVLPSSRHVAQAAPGAELVAAPLPISMLGATQTKSKTPKVTSDSPRADAEPKPQAAPAGTDGSPLSLPELPKLAPVDQAPSTAVD